MYYHDNIKSTFTLTPPIHSKNNRITDKFIRSVLALYSCTASWKGLYPSSLPVPCCRAVPGGQIYDPLYKKATSAFGPNIYF